MRVLDRAIALVHWFTCDGRRLTVAGVVLVALGVLVLLAGGRMGDLLLGAGIGLVFFGALQWYDEHLLRRTLSRIVDEARTIVGSEDG